MFEKTTPPGTPRSNIGPNDMNLTPMELGYVWHIQTKFHETVEILKKLT
jgi:hypothetical protein